MIEFYSHKSEHNILQKNFKEQFIKIGKNLKLLTYNLVRQHSQHSFACSVKIFKDNSPTKIPSKNSKSQYISFQFLVK